MWLPKSQVCGRKSGHRPGRSKYFLTSSYVKGIEIKAASKRIAARGYEASSTGREGGVLINGRHKRGVIAGAGSFVCVPNRKAWVILSWARRIAVSSRSMNWGITEESFRECWPRPRTGHDTFPLALLLVLPLRWPCGCSQDLPKKPRTYGVARMLRRIMEAHEDKKSCWDSPHGIFDCLSFLLELLTPPSHHIFAITSWDHTEGAPSLAACD